MKPNPRLWFIVRFAALLAILFTLLALRPVDEHFVRPFTAGLAKVSAVGLNLLGQQVEVIGATIRSSSYAVNVQNGCNGLEAVILLIAAIAAFPARMRARMFGLIAGGVAIQALNIVRIVSLYLLGKYYPGTFGLFHLAIWQTVFILVSLGLFVLWSRRVEQTTNRPVT